MAGSQYVGMAGHLAVMSEFAIRGYNVAIPEIDKGDDVFVVNDATGSMWRIQVKTAQGTAQKKSTRYQFRVKQAAINHAQTPELHFVWAMRASGGWRFLVMDRAVLRNYVNNQGLGSAAGAYRQFPVTLHNDGRVTGSGVNLAPHLQDWATWPPLP